jgi:hypothetical protein
MTSNQEDILMDIHTEVTQSNLWEEFNAQLKKMQSQEKHRWKDVCERWEYALYRIKGGEPA